MNVQCLSYWMKIITSARVPSDVYWRIMKAGRVTLAVVHSSQQHSLLLVHLLQNECLYITLTHARTHARTHTHTHTHTHTQRVLSCMMKIQTKCMGNLQCLRYLQELMYPLHNAFVKILLCDSSYLYWREIVLQSLDCSGYSEERFNRWII